MNIIIIGKLKWHTDSKFAYLLAEYANFFVEFYQS